MLNQKTFENFPVLETNRLVLRELRLTDKENVLALHSSSEVNRFIYRNTTTYTIENAARHIEVLKHFYDKKWAIAWAATLKGSDELIGICSFNSIDIVNHRAEIDGELLYEYWRKGFGIEGFLALIHFGFEMMNLHSITSKVFTENKTVVSLLEKFGFEKEGRLRDRIFVDGEYKDMYLYSVLKGEEKNRLLLEKYVKKYLVK